MTSRKRRTPTESVQPIGVLASGSAAIPEKASVSPIIGIPGIVAELQSLQRERSVIIKSRNMQANRLQAIVAGTLGYSTSLPEKERAKKFIEATAVIKAVADGTATHPLASVINVTMVGVNEFNKLKKQLEKRMTAMADQLPAASWVKLPEQRGFGKLFLAVVVGEAGNLSNYSGPGKLWKRFGCAPYIFDGTTKMGATWRGGREGKLPSEEWEKFGYSPRRRSIAYLIGEGIVKQNWINGENIDETEKRFADDPSGDDTGNGEKSGDTDESYAGPYRRRYDEAKRIGAEKHPDWSKLRCHRHGMLLATKLLLKHLWIEWRKQEST